MLPPTCSYNNLQTLCGGSVGSFSRGRRKNKPHAANGRMRAASFCAFLVIVVERALWNQVLDGFPIHVLTCRAARAAYTKLAENKPHATHRDRIRETSRSQSGARGSLSMIHR